MKDLAREIGILGVFITCAYLAVAYHNPLCGLGAVLSFLCVGNSHND